MSMEMNLQHMLMEESLVAKGSFVICDFHAEGFPIRAANLGFVDLFEYSAAESLGKQFESLTGGPSIIGSPSSLSCAASALGIPPGKLEETIIYVTGYIAHSKQAMATNPPPNKPSFILALNRKKSGSIFVCENVSLILKHSVLGWPFVLCMQRDISEEVSAPMLINAVSTGKYGVLIKNHEESVKCRASVSKVCSETAMQYFHVKALEAWHALTAAVKHSSTKGLKLTTLTATSTASGGSTMSHMSMSDSSDSECASPPAVVRPVAVRRPIHSMFFQPDTSSQGAGAASEQVPTSTGRAPGAGVFEAETSPTSDSASGAEHREAEAPPTSASRVTGAEHREPEASPTSTSGVPGAEHHEAEAPPESEARSLREQPGMSDKDNVQYTCLKKQLTKTKMCKHFLRGRCQYHDSCNFAHTPSEVVASPDLRKTRLCKAFRAGGCKDAGCKFAHAADDVSSTGIFYKTHPCKWFEVGLCRNGSSCRFAHGAGELSTPQLPRPEDPAEPEARRRNSTGELGTNTIAPRRHPLQSRNRRCEKCGTGSSTPGKSTHDESIRQNVSHVFLPADPAKASFLLCDLIPDGLTIEYASKGFEDLFGFAAQGCVGKKYDTLVSELHVSGWRNDLSNAAKTTRSAFEDIAETIRAIARYGPEALRGRQAARRFEQDVHSVVALSRRADGRIFLCETILQVFVHPVLGRPYVVVLQDDISSHISTERLLGAYSEGKYAELIRGRQEAASRRMSTWKARNIESALQHFHEAAVAVWTQQDKARRSGDLDQAVQGDFNRCQQNLQRLCSTMSEMPAGGGRPPAARQSAEAGTATEADGGGATSAGVDATAINDLIDHVNTLSHGIARLEWQLEMDGCLYETPAAGNAPTNCWRPQESEPEWVHEWSHSAWDDLNDTHAPFFFWYQGPWSWQ